MNCRRLTLGVHTKERSGGLGACLLLCLAWRVGEFGHYSCTTRGRRWRRQFERVPPSVASLQPVAGTKGHGYLALGAKHAAVWVWNPVGCVLRLEQGRKVRVGERVFLRVSGEGGGHDLRAAGVGPGERVRSRGGGGVHKCIHDVLDASVELWALHSRSRKARFPRSGSKSTNSYFAPFERREERGNIVF